jgi:hypothetical protein
MQEISFLAHWRYCRRGRFSRMIRPMTLEDRIRELLAYDPETGVLRWREGANRGKNKSAWRTPGREAGCVKNAEGYLHTQIDGKKFANHRIAWLLMTGEWPADGIDHRNGDPADNRWLNLREATMSENNQNLSHLSKNISGLRGVFFRKDTGQWRAIIGFGGRLHRLGTFDTPEAAHTAYLAAKATNHTFQPTPRDL